MNIRVYKDINELSKEAARFFEELLSKRDDDRPFTVALSGGSTPKVLYSMLASAPYREDIDWKNVVLFFGDERLVPKESAKSNYHMVSENLLMNIDIPSQNIHPIDGELPPVEAADLYEKNLRGFFNSLNSGKGSQVPVFDLILLGLGTDGHTLSIFPGSAGVRETSRFVVGISDGPEDTPKRVSMTLPLINNAKNVVVLVSGKSKAEVLRGIVGGEPKDTVPASLIEPRGELIYLVDEDAAALL